VSPSRLFLPGLLHNLNDLFHYRRIRKLQGAVSPDFPTKVRVILVAKGTT
jgi:hypothetical protein